MEFAMSNTLTAVTPKLLAQGLLALRENCVMPRLVNRKYEELAGQKGSTIDVPIPSAVAVQDVAPANTPPSTADVVPTSVPVPLDQWKEAPFYLTDKDMMEAMEGTIPMQASEAVKSLSNTVDQYLLAQYKKFYGHAGTAGTTPFALNTTNNWTGTQDATAVRRVLNKQLAPMDDRHVVFDPDAEANALNLRAFQDASWSGSVQAIIDGSLNRKLGFQWWMSQNILSHTAGGWASTGTQPVALVSNSAKLATTANFTIGGATTGNTFTAVEGDLFTLAGSTQQFVVTANGTISTASGGNAITFQPPLPAAVDGSGTPVAATVVGSHVANLAFHRDAIAFATRPLDGSDHPAVITQNAVDPVSGLSLRLEITREHKRNRFSYDILYGAAVVRRALGTRLLG